MKETHNQPDIKLKKSKISKIQRSDPNFYNQQIIAKNRPDARKKNSESQLGNKRSEETKYKQRLGMEKSWAISDLRSKIKQTKINHGRQLPDDQVPLYNLYYRKVNSHTYISLKKKFTKEELKKRTICGVNGGFQIDHRFSVIRGFINNILPSIVGCCSNLELIPWLNNTRKNSNCSITKEELFSLYDHEIKK